MWKDPIINKKVTCPLRSGYVCIKHTYTYNNAGNYEKFIQLFQKNFEYLVFEIFQKIYVRIKNSI